MLNSKLTLLCYLLIIGTGLLSSTGAQSSSQGTKRPNVLFIVVDDLRPILGCYGEPLLKTPNVDNLASKSILFNQTFVQQAVCGPSRISFLTSRRPDTTRLYDFYSYWRVHAGNYTTLPQHFKENGYITQSVGKVFHPGIASNHSDDSPYSWTNTPYHPPTQEFKNAKVCPNKDGTLGMNIVCPVDVEKMPNQSLPDLQSADFAVEFLRNLSETKPKEPFFLAVGFHKPHIPLKYPKKYKSLYPLSEVGLAKYNTYPWRMPLVAWNPFVDLRDRDDVKNLKLSFPFGPVPDDFQILMRQSYYAATSYMDAQVGRVLSALEKNGFSENTIISFIGDHGWSLGEHQEWSKYSLFEVAARVPFILYIPGLTYTKTEKKEEIFPYFDVFKENADSMENNNSRNTSTLFVESEVKNVMAQTEAVEPRYRTSALVELVDLFPTLADAAGLPTLPLCPNDPYKTWLCTEGTSLMPLIKNITINGTKVDMNVEETSLKFISDLSLLTQMCSKNFTTSASDEFQWKRAVFSQYPRPSVNPQHNTELPHLKDIRIMGYSMWTPDYHYTEWVHFSPKDYIVGWDDVYGRELYFRSSDPYEINNVALLEECFHLVEVLSKKLRAGWRGALPY